MDGWIKLHRKSIDSSVFKNPHLWHVWTYCLMRANHKQVKVLFNGAEIELQPGQFITGRFTGSVDCNMKPSTFRNQIVKLKTLQKLDIKSDNKKSLITIKKWTNYQGLNNFEDSKEDTKRTTNGHRQEFKKYNNGNGKADESMKFNGVING